MCSTPSTSAAITAGVCAMYSNRLGCSWRRRLGRHLRDPPCHWRHRHGRYLEMYSAKSAGTARTAGAGATDMVGNTKCTPPLALSLRTRLKLAPCKEPALRRPQRVLEKRTRTLELAQCIRPLEPALRSSHSTSVPSHRSILHSEGGAKNKSSVLALD